MKISWKHLSQLVDLKNIDVEDAANKLTLAGFEVDKVKYVKKNTGQCSKHQHNSKQRRYCGVDTHCHGTIRYTKTAIKTQKTTE